MVRKDGKNRNSSSSEDSGGAYRKKGEWKIRTKTGGRLVDSE